MEKRVHAKQAHVRLAPWRRQQCMRVATIAACLTRTVTTLVDAEFDTLRPHLFIVLMQLFMFTFRQFMRNLLCKVVTFFLLSKVTHGIFWKSSPN